MSAERDLERNRAAIVIAALHRESRRNCNCAYCERDSILALAAQPAEGEGCG